MFEENVKIQKQIYERFKENFERKKQNVISPSDPSGRSTVIVSKDYNSNGK